MKHALIRATNLITRYFNVQQHSLLMFGNPTKFYHITHAFYDDAPNCPMETRRAVAYIYKLQLYDIFHFGGYSHDYGFREHDLLTATSTTSQKDFNSTAAALRHNMHRTNGSTSFIPYSSTCTNTRTELVRIHSMHYALYGTSAMSRGRSSVLPLS
jgi:hypothetical protein